MKKLLVVLLLVSSARATVSCFANATIGPGPGGSGNFTSSAINTTGATLLVAVSTGDINPAMMFDSQNNVWQTASIFGAPSGSFRMQTLVLYVPNPVTSASHTFSIFQAAGLFSAAVIYACSGTTVNYPLASQNGLMQSSSGTFQPGSVTPVESGDLIVTGSGTLNASSLSPTIDSSFQTPVAVNSGLGNAAIAASYLVTSSGSAVNPTWTMGSVANWSSVIAVFKSSSATAPSSSGLGIKTFAGTASAFTGGFSGDGGSPTSAQLNWPSEIVLDSSGDVIFADLLNNRIRIINTQNTTKTLYNVSVCAGCIQTIAGSSTTVGFSGDGGAATAATLAHPVGMAIDFAGNVYVADQQNQRIRKITTAGIISTVAGSGVSTNGNCNNGAYGGDGGSATSATLNCPQGVAVDAAGNIYIADSLDYRVRAVNVQTSTQTLLGTSVCSGCIQTVAGNGVSAYCCDNGPATSANLGYPLGLGFDSLGNLYIATYNINRIREVSSTGTITTFAGNGGTGYSGDGGAATSAQLNQPFDVKADNHGNVFIADSQNNAIREVSGGVIETIAGRYSLYGIGGAYGGDGGSGTLAGLLFPIGVAINSMGNVFIGDLENLRIRELSASCYGVCFGNGTKLGNGISIH